MELGALKVGEVLFKNLFDIKPEFLDLFSFAELPDYESSEKYKDHI
jgi:hypothetical protein